MNMGTSIYSKRTCIPEFVDGAVSHIIQMWATIDGHYADVGDSAALLSRPLNVPLLFTGYYHHAGDGTGIVRL